MSTYSPLDSSAATVGESTDLCEVDHGGVAGGCHCESSVSGTVFDGHVEVLFGKESVGEAGDEAVPAADAVEDFQAGSGSGFHESGGLAPGDRAVRKAGDISGRRVCVVGAGTIGQLVVRSVRGMGATSVVAVDPQEARRSLAASGGATDTFTPDELRVNGVQADVVVECSGTAAAVDVAFGVAAPGGIVVLVGTGPEMVEFPVRRVVLHEIRITGSAAHVWDVDVAAAVAMLATGVVDPTPLISARVSLEDAVSMGFERLAADSSALKILITP